MEFPVTSLILCFPLVGALVVIALMFIMGHQVANRMAVGWTLLHLLLVSLLWLGSPVDLVWSEQYEWIPSIGSYYAVTIDSISFLFILLISGFVAAVSVWSFKSSSSESEDAGSNEQTLVLMPALLVLEFCMIGTVVAADLLLFALFWEFMLVPIFLIMVEYARLRAPSSGPAEVGDATIGLGDSPEKRFRPALGFVLYTMSGAIFLLVSILYLVTQLKAQTGQTSFLLQDYLGGKLCLTPLEQRLLFLGFAVAFLVKIPIFPFHSWLPAAQREAPIGMGVIFAAVLFKMGLYGLVRFAIPLFPAGAQQLAGLLGVFAVLSIIVSGLIAFRQTDLRYLIAYSSVSHLGFCLLGIASLQRDGVTGALFHGVAHGVSAGALFFLVGILYRRFGERSLGDYGGLAVVWPLLAGTFVFIMLGYLAVPLTNGFVGELMVLISAFQGSPLLASIGGLGVVIGAVYGLLLIERLFFGESASDLSTQVGQLSKLSFSASEGVVLVPLVFLTIYLGVFPQSVLRRLEWAVDTKVLSATQTQLESVSGAWSPGDPSSGVAVCRIPESGVAGD